MVSYGENTRKATLQELADGLCEDEEMQYVLLESQKTASLAPIEVGDAKSIFTKLKKYPYEFEIGEDLRLASVDGVKLENNSNSAFSREQINQMIEEKLNTKLAEMEEKYASKEEVKELQDSQKALFVPDVLFEGTAGKGSHTMADISQYKYIIVYYDCRESRMSGFTGTEIINVSKINYHNATTFKDDTSFAISTNCGDAEAFLVYWFQTPTQFYICDDAGLGGINNVRISRIEGLK